jgi:hypothetical protein
VHPAAPPRRPAPRARSPNVHARLIPITFRRNHGWAAETGGRPGRPGLRLGPWAKSPSRLPPRDSRLACLELRQPAGWSMCQRRGCRRGLTRCNRGRAGDPQESTSWWVWAKQLAGGGGCATDKVEEQPEGDALVAQSDQKLTCLKFGADPAGVGPSIDPVASPSRALCYSSRMQYSILQVASL